MDDEQLFYLRDFQRHARNVLSQHELAKLYKTLKDYQHHKRVEKLVVAMSTIIVSPQSCDIVLKIRLLIPQYQLDEFDRCVMKYGLASAARASSAHDVGSASLTVNNDGTYGARQTFSTSRASPLSSNTRVITLMKRDGDESLGFSVRGGADNNLGIFVSEVDAASPADAAGLKVGDRVAEVNTISVVGMSCATAARLMNGSAKVKLAVERTGRVPRLRFDTDVKKLIHGDLEHRSRSPALSDPWPNSTERKINLTAEGRGALGFNIRGGNEFSLGIYVSRVDRGGVAERRGLRVGDQIVRVNGTSFSHISHKMATRLLTSHRHLVLTVKAMGRYPAYKELCTRYTWVNGHRYHRPDLHDHRPSHVPQTYRYDVNICDSFESKIEAYTQTDDEDDYDTPQAMMSLKAALPANQFILRSSSSETNIAHAWPYVESHGQRDHSDLELEHEWSSVDDLLYDSKIQGRKRNKRSRSLKQRLIGLKKKSSNAQVSKHDKGPKHIESSGSVVRRGVFEKSFGSQMMYQMCVEAAVLVDLEERCKERLSHDEASAILRHVNNYHTSGDISRLLNILHLLLDTKHKLSILTQIRDIIHPSHIDQFYKAVKALRAKFFDNSSTSHDNHSDGDDFLGECNSEDENAVLENFEQIYADIEYNTPVGVSATGANEQLSASENGYMIDGEAYGGDQSQDATYAAYTRSQLEDMYAIPWRNKRTPASNPVAFDDLEAPAQWTQATRDSGDEMRVYELVASTVPSLRSVMRKYSLPNTQNSLNARAHLGDMANPSKDLIDSPVWGLLGGARELPCSHITHQVDHGENNVDGINQAQFIDDDSAVFDDVSEFDETEILMSSRSSHGSSVRGHYVVNDAVERSSSSCSQASHTDSQPSVAVEAEIPTKETDDLPHTIAMLSMTHFTDDFYEDQQARLPFNLSQSSTLPRQSFKSSTNFLLQSKFSPDHTTNSGSNNESDYENVNDSDIDENDVVNEDITGTSLTHEPTDNVIINESRNNRFRIDPAQSMSPLEMFQPKPDPGVVTLDIPKVMPTLGLSISGGSDSSIQPDVRVEEVIAGGSVSCDGRLKKGMEIVSVDGISLGDVSHSRAVHIIRHAFSNSDKTIILFVTKSSPLPPH